MKLEEADSLPAQSHWRWSRRDHQLTAQVQTIVPDPVPGAKPVTVEHIKIHGAALEGNLEGDAVDRDAIVFLPPSYRRQEAPLSRGLCAARLLHWRRAVDARDPRAADRSKAHSPRAQRR
jgi:hypothetical protein